MPRSLKPTQTAAPLLPLHPTLNSLREAAAGCRACDLWKTGTQTVFGEGARTADVMFVGEQPGDKEDLAGKPFVGPAGGVLNKALDAAGIERSQVYVTNIVKHFKWEPRGKRRIHKKPNAIEIAACRPWFDAEVAVTRPRVIVALGATAAQALLGKSFKVTQRRGEAIEWQPESEGIGAGAAAGKGRLPHRTIVVATVHPSSILRAPDDESRHAEMAKFIDDMKVIARIIRESEERPRKAA
jgi:uracil-DNA glycosylase